MTSLIIPAHNEENTIGRLLRGLVSADPPEETTDEVEILVVCNGCNDRTAEIARKFSPSVQVIETELASKAHALRLGDSAAQFFPRLYIDADVVLSRNAIRELVNALKSGACLAAAPRMCVDLQQSPWLVRSYYRIWMQLPYHRKGMIGSGVYAMSRKGRERFGEFPDLISDDGFARLHFLPSERRTIESCTFTIQPPSTLTGIINVKVRSQKGLLQLHRSYPELLVNDQKEYSSSLSEIIRDPKEWASSLVYLYVILRTKITALWKNNRGDIETWERDESSRLTARAKIE